MVASSTSPCDNTEDMPTGTEQTRSATLPRRWSRWLFWAILALPATRMCWRVFVSGTHPAELLHGSGEMSARLMLLGLMVTPLRLLWPSARPLVWLRRHRRSLGVAAFGYAALHLLFYVLDMETLRNVLAELSATGIWTGWIALLLFVPLGLTSNDWSVRSLGRSWQRLHYLVYPAALFTLIHWIFVHDNVVAAWVHFTPLILLEAYRVTVLFKQETP